MSRPFETIKKYSSLVLFVTLSVYKLRGHLLYGRFWAEEGSVFFSQFLDFSPIQGVGYLFNGHLELITNLLVLIATHVEFERAPLVTMYGALGIQFATFALIWSRREEFHLENWALCALAILMAGLPQATEVWGNSINIHFHMALAAAIVLASQLGSCAWRYLSKFILFIAGLSGIPANFLVPVAIVQAMRHRQAEYLLRALILSTTALLQIVLLLHAESGTSRELTKNPAIYWLAILSQQVISPLAPSGRLSDILISIIKSSLDANPFAVLIAVFLTVLALMAIKAQIARERSNAMKVVFASALMMALFSVAVSLGQKVELISSAGHGRYFYTPNVLMGIFVLRASCCQPRNNIALLLGVWVTVVCFKRLPEHASGVSWIESIHTISTTCSVPIAPNGWNIVLPESSCDRDRQRFSHPIDDLGLP